MNDFDVNKVRQDFPILKRTVHGKPLVYLDTAATAQKPKCVIDAISNYYEKHNANVHRSVHTLAEEATNQYEAARIRVQQFINAQYKEEIVFASGTTEAINLVAASFGKKFLKAGDEVIISEMEHHANIVPWQILRDEIGIKLQVIPLLDNGELDQQIYQQLFTAKTKLVAIVHASNALGTINLIQGMIEFAHSHGVPVLVDAAQSIVHGGVDVTELNCDFLAFSGHKLYGPTGIGVLYGKLELLKEMPPYQAGGEMIEKVTMEKTTYAPVPYKFEAGTPNISGAIGLSAAIDYLNKIGFDKIKAHEVDLLAYATEKLSNIPGLTIIGNAKHKVPLISFIMDDVHALDLATIIDHEGVAIRSGHHCAMPIMQHFGITASSRVSFGVYNTRAEIDIFVKALLKVRELFV